MGQLGQSVASPEIVPDRKTLISSCHCEERGTNDEAISYFHEIASGVPPSGNGQNQPISAGERGIGRQAVGVASSHDDRGKMPLPQKERGKAETAIKAQTCSFHPL